MRKIINLSLPENMVKEVEKTIKEKNYVSKSEFFRDLLRDWAENKILKDLEQSEKELKKGAGNKLRSLKELR